MIAPDGTFSSLHSFNGQDGPNPPGALALFSDGNFYGVVGATSSVNHDGYFQVSPDGWFTIVRISSWTAPDNLDAPVGSLIDGGDGNLYGFTRNNELARYSPAGSIQVVHSFQASEGI